MTDVEGRIAQGATFEPWNEPIRSRTEYADRVSERVERAVEALRQARLVIVVDDEYRENEGDLICAAQSITAEQVNFMITEGRGLYCVPLSAERADRLDLFPMTAMPNALHGTRFTVSVDAAEGTTSGTSAADRALTTRMLADRASRPEAFARPGHVFPLRGAEGGVLRRPGHTEAALDLLSLAGLEPAGALCEILHRDGSMLRGAELESFARDHGLPLVSVRDLVAYRTRREKLVVRLAKTRLPTPEGEFDLYLYEGLLDGDHHLALTVGEIGGAEPTLVRLHSQCLTGDVFASRRCDCGEQLSSGLATIAERGRGVFLYMRQEGRGIGLANKIRAYALQDHGLDTVEANQRLGFAPDLRDYGIGAQILADLGVGPVELLTNNPRKLDGLRSYGIEVLDRVPLEIEANTVNRRYLATKRDKLGHLLGLDETETEG